MQLREAADALGVHYPAADGWVRDGALPARKRGRGYEISEADVALLAQRRELGGEHRLHRPGAPGDCDRRAAAHLSLSHMKGESRGYL